MEDQPVQKLVDEAYQDVALILGGFLARTPVTDHAAWKLAGEVTGSWFRATSKLHCIPTISHADPSRHRLHPSVRSVLAAIRARASP
jgi:hypothetical protein